MLSVFEKNRTSKVISSLLELFYQKPILKILRNSQENTCVGDCFWIKLESVVMQLHYRRFWPYMEKRIRKSPYSGIFYTICLIFLTWIGTDIFQIAYVFVVCTYTLRFWETSRTCYVFQENLIVATLEKVL